jgi:hypothetical protein
MANWFEAIFEFLFKYRPTVFEKGDFHFGSPTSVIVLLLVSALIGIPALLTYAAVRGKSSRRDRLVLGALRGAAIVVVMICLFRPLLLLSAAVPQRNYVGVLIDDSRSMQIADLPGGGRDGRQARSQVVRQLMARADSGLRKALGDRFMLRYYRFASGAQRIAAPDDVTFAGGRTRIGDAIEQARQDLEAVPLSGLVVLTDGADNAQTPLGDELLSLRARSVPVFTVGIGRERFDKDIEVRRVEAARSALKGSALVVDVLVKQRGFGGTKVPLVVEDDGRLVSSEEITLPSDGDLAPVRVHVAVNEAGPRTLTFRIPLQAGEQVSQNNAQQALVVVRNRREKILYVDELRYEFPLIRRAVSADSNIQLVKLVRQGDNKFWRGDVDSAAELAGGFPKTRAELFTYRAIILGSVEASFFTHDQLQMLADFVNVRGGGLLLLGGRRSFAEGGYAGTPLSAVMPVVVEGDAVADSMTFFADLKVSLTPAGATHAATQVAPSLDKTAERWKTLPSVTSVNRIRRLKPGAVALLMGSVPSDGRAGGPGETASGYEQPVLAYQRYGRGVAIALPVQDTYLWRMGAEIPVEDQTFETFWRQLLRWLTSEVPDRVGVVAATDVVGPREPIALQADVADSGYVMRNDARVVAHVVAPTGAARDIPMEWAVDRDGQYRATFTPEESGLYQIKVDADFASGRRGSGRGSRTDSSATGGMTGLSSEPVYVRATTEADAGREFVDAEMRASLLKRIAQETGGRFYTPATSSSLAEDIALSTRGVTVVNQMDLWDMPVVLLVLLGLVSAEWGYRKARGLV